MANPKKQTPWVIEMRAGGKWYPLEAFRTEDAANDMLPIFKKRTPNADLRVRNVLAEGAPL